MSNVMAVLLNGTAQIEYNREIALPARQRDYLARMDQDMDAGIQLGNRYIDMPDQTQRAQFVALHLIQSLLVDNEQHIAASCAYLADRLPDLKQVKAVTKPDGAIGIDLVFSEDYKNQVKVEFIPPGSTGHTTH
ncbi:MAG: hypothetical protein ACWGOW_02925 [Gammaproteobacteria bacterium]